MAVRMVCRKHKPFHCTTRFYDNFSKIALSLCEYLLHRTRLQLNFSPFPFGCKKAVCSLTEIIAKPKTDTDLKHLREDRFLLRFLRVCKYYPETAAELSNMLTYSRILRRHNVCVAFKNHDQHNRRIVVLRLGKVALDEIFKAAVLYVKVAVAEEESQINGAVAIFDMDGLSLQQTWQFTPAFAKRLID
ncbi:hypothetical protein GQX74_009418 [Glossina fuscipes]|nr:hypothetical protein GQX74_009418 [Glossina fuscipes]